MMIALIRGEICHLSAPTVCVMTQSGVGYEMELPIPDFCQLTLGSSVTLFTHLHVREDAQLLFGFLEKQDREVFRTLIKITGVGAKMALAMLSAMPASQLKRAVEMDDDHALTKIPGIGKKTAQRLVIELKGKLTDIGVVSMQDDGGLFQVETTGSVMQVIAEVESALISLGYKEKEAQNAIKKVQSDEQDTQALLKAALKQLSGF